VIDDRLPVDSTKSLLFCSNKKFSDEFWCALIEKAYAKVNGCYQFLDGGLAQGNFINTCLNKKEKISLNDNNFLKKDAIVDLTGGVGEYFNIMEFKDESKTRNLWGFLRRSTDLKSLISVSIANFTNEREPHLKNGLIKGHAVSYHQKINLKKEEDIY
jgi:calpain-5